MIKEGQKAPEFSLPSSEGGEVSLKSLKGKPVVLYFYPKDDTPGCTREACAFRDAQAAIKKTGAVVLGVSPDSLAAHDKFTAKYKLNFPLLSDPDKAVASEAMNRFPSGPICSFLTTISLPFTSTERILLLTGCVLIGVT